METKKKAERLDVRRLYRLPGGLVYLRCLHVC